MTFAYPPVISCVAADLVAQMAGLAKPDPWDLIAEDDAKREAHVAKVTPRMVRVYTATPDRVAEAFDYVGDHLLANPDSLTARFGIEVTFAPLMDALLARDDHAEIGRLVLAAMDARIQQVAEDAATEDGYRVVPERPLP